MTKSPGERTTIRRANTEWTPPVVTPKSPAVP